MSAVVGESRTESTAEFRKPVLTLVNASWQNSDGTLQTATARMEDKSAGGACIRIKEAIAVGSRLRIQSRHEDFSGTSRYCRAETGEYLVGIQRDPANRPLPDQPAPTGLSTRRSVLADGPISTAKASMAKPGTRKAPAVNVTIVEVPPADDPLAEIKSPTPRPAAEPNEAHALESKAGSGAHVSIARSPSIPAPRGRLDSGGHEIEGGNDSKARPDLASLLPAQPLAVERLSAEASPETPAEIQTRQPPRQAAEGRKSMRDKWLTLPWGKKQDGPSPSGPGNGHADGEAIGAKENPMHDMTQSAPKPPLRSAREVPNFHVDLPPMEDVYRAAGIIDPGRGYSITKVAEMLHSGHIRDLSKDLKRAAILMALETAGVPVDQIERDAKARQDALHAHEALQRKNVEAEWARKAEEIVRIQGELESIKAHYMARISQNMEGVAREKEAFASWVALKQQECQRITDAVELCLKPAASASTPANGLSNPSLNMNTNRAQAADHAV